MSRVEKRDDGLVVIEAPSALVTYVMPTYEVLQKRFPQYVNSNYMNAAFVPIAERADMNRTPRELPFKYVQRRPGMSDIETILAMVRRQLLPAIPEEALDFLKEHPQELQVIRKAIWALGAQMNSRVLCAWDMGHGGKLDLNKTGNEWDMDARWDMDRHSVFLAVPQAAFGVKR